jgi:hypothetical protein
MMQVLEGTAQEVFRVLLFLVFTLEVFLISLLPFIGECAEQQQQQQQQPPSRQWTWQECI